MTEAQVRRACLLLAAVALFACMCGLPLVYDGPYQLAQSLIEQRPFAYLTRFHSWFLCWPVVWLSRVTDDLTALLLAYGLPLLGAPAASLWLAWRIVRRYRPELAVWAAFGVAAASLPGQVFVVNDSNWQQTIFWPVLLAMFVPLSRRGRIAFVVLAVFQFSHQIGAVMLGVAFGAGVIMARFGPAAAKERRWQLAAVGILFVLAAAKVAWVSNPNWSRGWFDSYAAQEATWQRARDAFRWGVWGLPFAGLALAWCTAALIALGVRTRWIGGALALVAIAWTWWAADPHLWAGAINYRRWVVPLAMPFYAFALLDALRSSPPAQPARGHTILALAAIYALVISLQSLEWRSSVKRLLAVVEASAQPIVTPADVPWIRGTPMEHWGVTTLVMVSQGKTPAHYFAFDSAGRAALSAAPPRIALAWWNLVPAEPGAAGYYDHRPLLRSIGMLPH